MAKDKLSPEHYEVLKKECAGDVARLRRLVKRMKMGELLEYVLGYQDFDGRRYFCDRRAYISQSDSLDFLDVLEANILGKREEYDRPLTLCEVGTGSGALLSALLHRLGKAGFDIVFDFVVGCDIDPSALEVARKNFSHHGHSVRLIESDCLEQVDCEENFDVIFAYPPWGVFDPEDEEFQCSEWGVFHRAVPPTSCYSYDHDVSIHEDIIAQTLRDHAQADLYIFNDTLPHNIAERIMDKFHEIALVPCGRDMSMFTRRAT